jgi:ankyrin repeat protein
MKKSIVYLGAFLFAFSSSSFASNEISSNTLSITTPYSDITPLCVAISKGEVEIVKKFIEYGADINEKSNGMTPLMVAARFNNVEIIQLLISKGANTRQKDEKGFTALKYAELSNANEAIAALKGL